MSIKAFVGTYEMLSGSGLPPGSVGPIKVDSHAISSVRSEESDPYIIRGCLRGFARKCGFLSFETSVGTITVEVLPKAWADDEFRTSSGSFDRWLTIFDKLLADDLVSEPTERQRILEVSNLHRRTKIQSVLELFLTATLEDVKAVLKLGIPREMEKVTDRSYAVRGRIVWAKQIPSLFGLKHKHVIEFNDLNHNDRICGFLRAGTRELTRRFSSTLLSNESKQLAREILHLTADFAEIDIRLCEQSVIEFCKFPSPRMAHIRPAVSSLAKWIYNQRSINDVRTLNFTQIGFSLNLEKVFEDWCRKEVSEALTVLGSSFACTTGSDEQWLWGQYGSKDSKITSGRMIKPDLVIYKGVTGLRNVFLIGDAKYKTLSLRGVDFERDSSSETEIDRNDIFQVFTYRTAIGTGPKSIVSVKGRQPVTFDKVFSSAGPKIVIFVPSDRFAHGDGFLADQFDKDWTLKLIEFPFNAYLRDEPDYKQDIMRFIYEIVTPEIPTNEIYEPQ